MPGPPPALTTTAAREPDPIDRVTIPIQPIGDALASMPGIIDADTLVSTSLGPGRGSNAGTGDGPGLGGGHGDGLENGEKGGFGGGVFGPGTKGVTMPIALHMERPSYSTDAMRARIQGVVVIDCVVRPNGRCSDIRVARSLDPVFGLDEEAKRAVTLWRFKPGTYRGDPVPVIVRLELEFTIR
jgi:protein TonB